MTIDMHLLFTGSDDQTIGIWELQNNYNVGFLSGHKDSIQDMIVLPDIGLLMSCSYDKNLIVWKYHEERELARLERSEELRCMDYLKSLKTLFVGTNDKIILTIPLEEILHGTGDSKYAYNKDD
jgi:WD40 repeat protein